MGSRKKGGPLGGGGLALDPVGAAGCGAVELTSPVIIDELLTEPVGWPGGVPGGGSQSGPARPQPARARAKSVRQIRPHVTRDEKHGRAPIRCLYIDEAWRKEKAVELESRLIPACGAADRARLRPALPHWPAPSRHSSSGWRPNFRPRARRKRLSVRRGSTLLISARLRSSRPTLRSAATRQGGR